mmetsp:Transcript_17451/g.26890  ORF Transcript_17451/g.26890 Transcript_17451/m.26890 type:complete len:106 (+) Transcript_17451:716-1033(+)
MKFFTFIFLVFTIISLPVFVLFAFSPAELSSNVFFMTSIGHLGQTTIPCRSVNLTSAAIAENDGLITTFDLSCSAGRLNFLVDFGLASKFSLCPRQEKSDVGREI